MDKSDDYRREKSYKDIEINHNFIEIEDINSLIDNSYFRFLNNHKKIDFRNNQISEYISDFSYINLNRNNKSIQKIEDIYSKFTINFHKTFIDEVYSEKNLTNLEKKNSYTYMNNNLNDLNCKNIINKVI
jgi:hypothetical protein